MRELFDTQPESREQMRLITGAFEYENVVTKSRFIAYLAPVETVEAADAVIRERRALHPGARHHCTALTLGTPVNLQRSNDDGEPGGTAGMPIAQALRGRHMTNIVCVVTRYFGGVKLGAGGLTRAYGSAVTEALDAAGAAGMLRDRVVREVSVIHVGYELAGGFEAAIRAWADAHQDFAVAEVHYAANNVAIEVEHSPGLRPELDVASAELSSGAVQVSTAGWAYADVVTR